MAEETQAANQPGNFALNPGFQQLAFLVGVVLLLGAWKFGIEGLME